MKEVKNSYKKGQGNVSELTVAISKYQILNNSLK